MMNHWLSIALVAYLMGAAIEGVTTASQLYRSLPELTKEGQDKASDSTNRWEDYRRVFVVIASVSICGACFWPCRLLHRLIKGNVSSDEL